MKTAEFMTADGILLDIKPKSKKHVLQAMTERAAAMTGIDSLQIFNAITERERLGPTIINPGVALPHGKIDALKKTYALLARLDRPIEFDNVPGQTVDIVFLLLMPGNTQNTECTETLENIEKQLRDPETLSAIRQQKYPDGILEALTDTRKHRYNSRIA